MSPPLLSSVPPRKLGAALLLAAIDRGVAWTGRTRGAGRRGTATSRWWRAAWSGRAIGSPSASGQHCIAELSTAERGATGQILGLDDRVARARVARARPGRGRQARRVPPCAPR
jgi:hypothetical protein